MNALKYCGFYEYLPNDGVELFTVVLLPEEGKRFPSLIIRSPYVDAYEKMTEDEIVDRYLAEHYAWLANGYAVVYQHCRGRGKSSGDCIPYINERSDGLMLQDWIRKQSFYNGELYLFGGSYLTSVHYATAPYADDIKGAVLNIQDCERYNINYRNGFFKLGLHGRWYVGMYKHKTMPNKAFTPETFHMLPLSDLSMTVFGEPAEDLDLTLQNPDPKAPFWQTLMGGSDARDAVRSAKIPILYTTGFYDIYTGGIFDMWHSMSEEQRNRCALVVSAYDHGDSPNPNGITYPDGRKTERFGEHYAIDWCNAIRNGTKTPVEQGKISYYRAFENQWGCDDFKTENKRTLGLGNETFTYTYNPYDPPRFKGGLSASFGGSEYQDTPNSRHDIKSIYTAPFAEDTFVKGKMQAELSVSTDCEDTCFYIRISKECERGDIGLRDDITSVCWQNPDYRAGEKVRLTFNFDEHAFLVRRGERLRIDIASADAAHYVRHTNQKGLFSVQTTCKIAHNTVYLGESSLTLPVEA